MKKSTSISIRTMALTLALFMMLTTVAFAGEPIPGVGVGLGKNPGGSIMSHSTTDSKGKFTIPPREEVSLQCTVSAAEVKKAIAEAKKYVPLQRRQAEYRGPNDSTIIKLYRELTKTIWRDCSLRHKRQCNYR